MSTSAAVDMETLLNHLNGELAALMTSGQNWQVVLHGGRGGDVRIEVKRTASVLPPRRTYGPSHPELRPLEEHRTE